MLRREFIGSGALAAGATAAGLKPASATSCIVLLMVGGPSQLDTFDPKPDAPTDIRGPFRAIRTSAPEIQISELFPQLAKHARKFLLIRSMHYPGDLLHEEGLQLALTGKVPADNASFRVAALPGSFRDVASYGKTLFGDRCRAALAAVEDHAGTVVVPMYDSAVGVSAWDMHGYSPFSTFAAYRDAAAPTLDFALTALLSDLDQRGLLKTTLVVALSEFGRTPKINPTGGRDHWTKCWTTLIAGGGVEGGQILGTSDAHGAEPRDNAMTPSMLLQLIGEKLGNPPSIT